MELNLLSVMVTVTLILNIFLAVFLIFLERRDASSTWAWLMVLFFIPIVGFIAYLLLGRKLRKKHLFRWEGRNKIGIDKLIDYQIDAIDKGTFDFKLDDSMHYKDLINMHLRNNHAV